MVVHGPWSIVAARFGWFTWIVKLGCDTMAPTSVPFSNTRWLDIVVFDDDESTIKFKLLLFSLHDIIEFVCFASTIFEWIEPNDVSDSVVVVVASVIAVAVAAGTLSRMAPPTTQCTELLRQYSKSHTLDGSSSSATLVPTSSSSSFGSRSSCTSSCSKRLPNVLLLSLFRLNFKKSKNACAADDTFPLNDRSRLNVVCFGTKTVADDCSCADDARSPTLWHVCVAHCSVFELIGLRTFSDNARGSLNDGLSAGKCEVHCTNDDDEEVDASSITDVWLEIGAAVVVQLLSSNGECRSFASLPHFHRVVLLWLLWLLLVASEEVDTRCMSTA